MSSRPPSPLIAVEATSKFSGRARAGFAELNRVAANPKLGASLQQIKAGIKERETRDTTKHDPRDLIAYLTQDNQDLWQQLLRNPFCQKMREAAADNEAVMKGFKWYMVQDFLYCIRLMNYETDRSSRATSAADFDASADRIADDANYAKDGLKTCTTTQPGGLGITDYNVLTAPPTEALTSYTEYQIQTAQEKSWVLALVAMVPCIQSYYTIAVDLKDNSAHKDTLWYDLWAVENAKYEDSTIHQREFFIQNFEAWKNHFVEANEIFRKACQGEIDLWATALDPVDV